MDEKKKTERRARFADSTPPPLPKRSFAHHGGEVVSNAAVAVPKFKERMSKRHTKGSYDKGKNRPSGKQSSLNREKGAKGSFPQNNRHEPKKKDSNASKAQIVNISLNDARAAFESIKTLSQRLLTVQKTNSAVAEHIKILNDNIGKTATLGVEQFIQMMVQADKLRRCVTEILLEGYVGSNAQEAGFVIHKAHDTLNEFFTAAANYKGPAPTAQETKVGAVTLTTELSVTNTKDADSQTQADTHSTNTVTTTTQTATVESSSSSSSSAGDTQQQQQQSHKSGEPTKKKLSLSAAEWKPSSTNNAASINTSGQMNNYRQTPQISHHGHPQPNQYAHHLYSQQQQPPPPQQQQQQQRQQYYYQPHMQVRGGRPSYPSYNTPQMQ
jgi:hypothetical protein